MLTFTQFQTRNPHLTVSLTLSLTAEQRTRSRYHFPADDGQMVCLCLPRGTILKDGDILQDETNNISIKIIAKPEPVLTVKTQSQLDLMKAAYHLGNRHVKLEITPNYLRLSPSKVLRQMLENLGLQVTEEVLPFQPETGAYGQHHPH